MYQQQQPGICLHSGFSLLMCPDTTKGEKLGGHRYSPIFATSRFSLTGTPDRNEKPILVPVFFFSQAPPLNLHTSINTEASFSKVNCFIHINTRRNSVVSLILRV